MFETSVAKLVGWLEIRAKGDKDSLSRGGLSGFSGYRIARWIFTYVNIVDRYFFSDGFSVNVGANVLRIDTVMEETLATCATSAFHGSHRHPPVHLLEIFYTLGSKSTKMLDLSR